MNPNAWPADDPLDMGCPVCGLESCDDPSHWSHADANGGDRAPGAAPPGDAPQVIGYTLDELRTAQFPLRQPLLMRGDTPILRAGQLAEVFADRGVGKTMLLHSFALAVASGGSVMGFSAPTPRPVLIIDGEMSGHDLQDRLLRLSDTLRLRPSLLTVVAADWQANVLPRLDTAEGQAALEPHIAGAELVVADNRSCLLDPEGERDPVAWQPAQDLLLSLRRRGKAVVMAHHANRQGGARGHGKPEDTLDILIKLERPGGYAAERGAHFTLSFEKARGVFGAAVGSLVARLTPDGWVTSHGDDPDRGAAVKLIEFVRLSAGAGEPVKSATKAIAGAKVNKSTGLKVWAELLDKGRIARAADGEFYVP